MKGTRPLAAAATAGALLATVAAVHAAAPGSSNAARTSTAPPATIATMTRTGGPTASAPSVPGGNPTPVGQLPTAHAASAAVTYPLPHWRSQSCEGAGVAHPVGLAVMGGTGQDVITRPDGSSMTYQAFPDHAPMQFVCTGGSADGGVVVKAVLVPVSADTSAYDFAMGPNGLRLVAVDLGRSSSTADILPVNVDMGPWPSAGCRTVSLPDLGPRHGSLDDTFCFDAGGALTHVGLNETITDTTGVHRDLHVTMDIGVND